MDGLEYRRIPTGPAAAASQQLVSTTADVLGKHLRRVAWMVSAAALAYWWQLHRVPFSVYTCLASVSLLVFCGAFAYIVANIRLSFGYSSSAPPHRRWKHYAPRAVLVMSVASFLSYCFACCMYYPQQGILVVPGIAVVCYGFSCLLSYL